MLENDIEKEYFIEADDILGSLEYTRLDIMDDFIRTVIEHRN
ncbi:hypothetical protein [Clostridium butyricum]